MPATVPAGHPWLHVAIAAGLLLPLQCSADYATRGRTATSNFSVTITIRPQFRIIESRTVPGGHEYRVWTNMKSVRLGGREFRFERVGESTLVVPGELIEQPDPATLMQQSAQPPAEQGT